MTPHRRDLITGGVFAAGALTLFLVASGYPVRESQALAVSPGFYPRLLALILAVLSGIQIISALVAGTRDAQEDLPPIWKDRRSFLLFCITLGALIAYPFLMRLIGFAPTGLMFLGALIYALSEGHRKGRELIIIAVITMAIGALTFVVFKLFLKIPFPSGIFGP